MKIERTAAKRLMSTTLAAAAAGWLVLVPQAACAPPATGSFDHLDPDFASRSYWHQGKAEINLYHATLIKYGEPRSADSVAHILVTEKHDPELLVKADDWRRPGLVDMVKFNYVTSVRTGVYAYQQMLSFFFAQPDLRLAKMTLASHEWCGNTFKELVNFRGRSHYDFNTYWDGQGNGSYEVDFPADLVVYESLPVQLRALRWKPGLTTGLTLLGPQLSSRVSPPEPGNARLEVAAPAELAVPAGTFDAYPVTLEHAGGVDRLWFEQAFPHRLLRWQTFDGNEFALAKSDKLAYWELSKPGDERYLE